MKKRLFIASLVVASLLGFTASPSAAQDLEERIRSLESELDALKNLVRQMPQQGPPGPKGPEGPRGLKGDRGDPGRPGSIGDQIHVKHRLSVGMRPSDRGEDVRIRRWAIIGEYGSTAGSLTFMPPDGTGFYHISNPGGQKLMISGGGRPGQHNYMTIGHPGKVVINGDLTVTGNKRFAQPHPRDPSELIVYVSLEGPEAGTYTRGTSQLINGQAVVTLPEHFSLVTNDDGLTVMVSCLDDCNGLRVIRKGAREIVVKELLNGTSSAKFDYLVQGVRKGYEDYKPVQRKR